MVCFFFDLLISYIQACFIAENVLGCNLIMVALVRLCFFPFFENGDGVFVFLFIYLFLGLDCRSRLVMLFVFLVRCPKGVDLCY